jgi:hypothetical protein
MFLKKILSDPNLNELNITKRKDEINNYKSTHPYIKDTKNFSMRSVLNSIQKIINPNLSNYIIVTDV